MQCIMPLHREDGSGLHPLEDVFSYSTPDNTWQRHNVTGHGPRARNAAIACVIVEKHMLLHGGWDPFKETYDDTFILHI